MDRAKTARKADMKQWHRSTHGAARAKVELTLIIVHIQEVTCGGVQSCRIASSIYPKIEDGVTR